MLRALDHPLSFLLLILSFLLAVGLHVVVQRRPVPLRRTPSAALDPFGAVAAALAGVGWCRPLDLDMRSRRPRGLVGSAVVGAAANLVLGCGALVGYAAAGGAPVAEGSVWLLQRGADLPLLQLVLLLLGVMNVFVGLLSLVPVPPLDGGRLLLALAPRTHGWQRARYQLEEQNLGVVALLALVLLPLGGPLPVLPWLLDLVATPLVTWSTGG